MLTAALLHCRRCFRYSRETRMPDVSNAHRRQMWWKSPPSPPQQQPRQQHESNTTRTTPALFKDDRSSDTEEQGTKPKTITKTTKVTSKDFAQILMERHDISLNKANNIVTTLFDTMTKVSKKSSVLHT